MGTKRTDMSSAAERCRRADHEGPLVCLHCAEPAAAARVKDERERCIDMMRAVLKPERNECSCFRDRLESAMSVIEEELRARQSP